MNVIIAYLETMFGAYPRSARMLEAKAELQTMMEDAYSGFIAAGLSENEAVGRVITEFGNLDELAPVLGITAEITPGSPTPTTVGDPAIAGGIAGATAGAADAAGRFTAAPRTPAPPLHAPVTLDEAQGFAEAHRSTRFRLAAAVALFVISPVVLIVLPTAAQSGVVALSENVATIIGMVVFFVLIAGGVLTLIGISREFAPYHRIRERRFSFDPAVTAWAEELAQQHERRRIGALQVAVLCWVLSPTPVVLLALLTEGEPRSGLWSVVGVAGTLVLVAIGLLTLLPAAWAHSAAAALGRASGAQPARVSGDADESERSLVGVIAAFYWPLTVAIFLAWSFIGNAWDRSWIIWPIAGVLFGALAAGISTWESYRKRRG